MDYFSSILLPGEQVIYNFTQKVPQIEESNKLTYLVLGIVFIIASLISATFAITSNIGLAFVAAFLIIGVIFIILYSTIHPHKVLYAYLVTNKRVMEVRVEDGRPTIIRSCWIFEIQPVVARAWISGHSIFSNSPLLNFHTEQEYGDVAFIKDGQVCLAFYNVPNPTSIRDIIIALIKSNKW